MFQSLRIDLVPFLIVFALVAGVIGGSVFALYKGLGRLIAYLEKHER